MRKPKSKTLKDHTARRLIERYGLKYTQLLRDTLINHVRSGKATLVVKQSLRVSVWDTIYEVRESEIIDPTIAKPGEVRIRYAYDKNRKTLITVLLPDMDPENLEHEDEL